MYLIAFRRLEPAPLTTTMGHCRCQNHHDAPLSWFGRLSTGPGLVTGGAEAAGEAHSRRSAARIPKEPPPCDTYVAMSLPVVIMVQEFVSLITRARTARGDMAIRRN
jgi:hypothetical protein